MFGFIIFIAFVVGIFYFLKKYGNAPTPPEQPQNDTNTSIPQSQQSFEEQLANYYLSLDSPHDKNVIVRFANQAGIDLDNPRPVENASQSVKVRQTKQAQVATAAVAAEPIISGPDLVQQESEPIDYDAPTNQEPVPYVPPAPAFEMPAIDNANYLLFVGAALIVVAILFFANAASSTFGTGVRFIALLLSSIVLFVLGLWIYKAKEALRPVGATFIWITLLSVPAIGFSLYRDVLGSDGAQWAWFIASVLGIIYIWSAYIFIKDNKYLEYMIYAASLNMLLASVATISVQIKIFSVAGLVYAALLLILYKLKIIGKEKELPIGISFTVALGSSILFLIQLFTDFTPQTAAWAGVYGLGLAGYMQLLITVYKERITTDVVYLARFFQTATVAWSLSFIGAGLSDSFSSFAVFLPVALIGLVSVALGIRGKLSTGAFYTAVVTGGLLVCSSLVVSPNKFASSAVIIALGAVLLIIANIREDELVPYASFAALVAGGLLLNSAGGYSEFITGLTIASLVGFAIAASQVLLQAKNRNGFLFSAGILWTIAVIAQAVDANTTAIALLFVAGAAVLAMWQHKYQDVYFVTGSLILSVLAPLIGFYEPLGWLVAVSIATLALTIWLLFVRFVPTTYLKQWLQANGLLIAFLGFVATIIDNQAGWPVLFALAGVSAIFGYIAARSAAASKIAFATLASILLLTGVALLGSIYLAASEVVGVLFATCFVLVFVWQKLLPATYITQLAPLFSLLAPLAYLPHTQGWLTTLVVVGIVLATWLGYTRFVPDNQQPTWFTLYGFYVISLAVMSSTFVPNQAGWPIVLGLVPVTVIVLYLTRTFSETFRAGFAFVSVVLLSVATALIGFDYLSSTSAVITALLVEAICAHVLLLPFALAVQSNVPTGQRISTYARITTIGIIGLFAFAPTVSNELTSPLLYSLIAFAGLCSVMSEGFLQNNAKLRYGGSAIAMLGILQIIHEAEITNFHVYSHTVAIYLVGLAVVVWAFRKRKDIMDNLLLAAVLVVLLPLSIDAFAGSTVASLTLLIEAFVIMLVSALFRKKNLVIASGSILVLSILYRVSGALARIPVWVWYLLVGIGLIAGAAYMLQKSGKEK